MPAPRPTGDAPSIDWTTRTGFAVAPSSWPARGMQQRVGLGHIVGAAGRSAHGVHQARLRIYTDVRLHAEIPLLALLALLHLRVAFAVGVLGRTRRGVQHEPETQDGRLNQHPLVPAARPAKSRNSAMSCSASSIAGALRLNHCRMKWTRSITSTANGGRPRWPSGMQELINATDSDHGTTRSTLRGIRADAYDCSFGPVQGLSASSLVSSQLFTRCGSRLARGYADPP